MPHRTDAAVQTALIVSEIGKPVSLVERHPVPQPGPGQVQVKVTVAGLNPHDRKARDTGIFIADNLPAVLANDVVGIVTKLGEAVTKFEIGDRIVAQAGLSKVSAQNGLQQYAVVDEFASARVPESIGDDQAATLPCNISAPLMALFNVLAIPAPWNAEAEILDYANASILIVGGGSNCGKFAIQLVGLVGFGKIVAVGGNEIELKGFGATHVIDRHGSQDEILKQIRLVVGDDLVYAFDTVNPPEGQILAANALSSHKKGALARLLPLGPVDESKVLGKHAGFEVRNVFGISHANPELARGFWKRLPAYLEAGQIKPLNFVVKHGLQADVVNEVLDRYRDGLPVVKTHIHF